MVKPHSRGTELIDRYLESVVEGHYADQRQIEAAIWERNPWKDLSREREFNASFFWEVFMTRSFRYLDNKAGDDAGFLPQGSTAGACDYGAGNLLDAWEGIRAVPVVDSVEADTFSFSRFDPAGYRRLCPRGQFFQGRSTTTDTYNAVPGQFLKHVKSTGAQARKLASPAGGYLQRVFLEAFPHVYGKPFVIPDGVIEGYVLICRSSAASCRLDPRELSLWSPSSGAWPAIREEIMNIEKGLATQRKAKIELSSRLNRRRPSPLLRVIGAGLWDQSPEGPVEWNSRLRASARIGKQLDDETPVYVESRAVLMICRG